MEDSVYRAIEKLLKTHVKTWKGVKSQSDGLGYVLNMIEHFVDDHDSAFTYAYGEQENG